MNNGSIQAHKGIRTFDLSTHIYRDWFLYVGEQRKTTKEQKSAGNPIPRGLSNLDGYIFSINDPSSPVNIGVTKQIETKKFV